MTDAERIDRIAAYIHAQLRADALRAVADPADEFGPEDVTTFRLEVNIEPAEVDPDTGEELCPERITATAYDNGHHSNVLFIELTPHGMEVS